MIIVYICIIFINKDTSTKTHHQRQLTYTMAFNRTKLSPEICRTIYTNSNTKLLQKYLKLKGLPENGTWKDINDYDSEQNLRKYLKLRGLPENGTWKDINDYDSEQNLRKYLKLRGLPENGTWKDINDYDSEQNRRK